MKDIVIITGGSKGIGRCLSLEYAKRGYTVITLDIIEPKYKDENIYFYKMDLGNEEEIKNVFLKIKDTHGKANILINNGAISKFNKNIKDITYEEFSQVIDVNLKGAFMCSKMFIELNGNEEYGRIVNIASTRWHQNEENWEAYGASKGGIVSLTNSLCVSLSNTKITVNAVSPGWIECEDYKSLSEEDHKMHPSGRVGKPIDIFNICYFLTNKENDFINGANILIDGGMTKRMIY